MEKGTFQKRFLYLLFFLVLIKFLLALFNSLPLDMDVFLAWSKDLATENLSLFYEKWKITDPYPPFSLYLFWISGKISRFFPQNPKFHEFLIKSWAVLAEIFGGYLIYKIAKRYQKENLGKILLLGYWFNPAIIFNTCFWGQLDSLLATLLFFSLYFLEKKRPFLATTFFAFSFLCKPQAVFFSPIFGFLLLRNFSLKKILFVPPIFLLIIILLFFPFLKGKNPFWIVSYHLERLKQYPYATANAFNFWMLFGGQTTLDSTRFLGLPYSLWGIILIVIFNLLLLFWMEKEKNNPFSLYFGGFLSFFVAFFFGTRMHERYLIPALIFLTASIIWEERLFKILIGLTLCILGNVVYIWWRAWEAITKDNPFFLWAPKYDKFGIFISLLTLFLFFFSLYFLFEKKLKFPKILGSNFSFSFFQNFFKENREKEKGSKKTKILFLFLILFLSFFTRFILIWYPPEVVFDEVHYGKAVNGYFRGEYFFTGHPPLGPQLIALGGFFGKYKPIFPFENIGEKFTSNSYIFLRIPPTLAGALIPVVLYFFARTIGFSQKMAFFVGLFLIFENALLVQSKFILIDSFWILFGFLGLNFFLKSKEKNFSLFLLILAGIFLGGAMAVKWTSLSFFLFVGFILIPELFKRFFVDSINSFLKFFLKVFFGLCLVPFLVYLFCFFVHFKLLPKSGPGDIYMSAEFLQGKKNFLQKFIEVNKVSYETNIKANLQHPYSSKFYTWPLLLRPIYYWVGGKAKIYLIGNPILWWFSSAGIFLLFLLWVFNETTRKEKTPFLILLGYFVSLMPYFSVSRCTFLYHYFPALIFSILSLTYLLEIIKNGEKILFFILIFVFLCFLYFAPLSYGFPLEPEQYQMRIWLKSWI